MVFALFLPLLIMVQPFDFSTLISACVVLTAVPSTTPSKRITGNLGGTVVCKMSWHRDSISVVGKMVRYNPGSALLAGFAYFRDKCYRTTLFTASVQLIEQLWLSYLKFLISSFVRKL